MCGYCWGYSYIEGTGRALPNSPGFMTYRTANIPDDDIDQFLRDIGRT